MILEGGLQLISIKLLSIFCSCTDWFVTDPEDWFSPVAAHVRMSVKLTDSTGNVVSNNLVGVHHRTILHHTEAGVYFLVLVGSLAPGL